MKITYANIEETNANFPKDSVKNPVGVFVGATNGIGEHTAYEFAKVTVSPTLYIAGRSAERGAQVEANIKKLNPDAKVHFLQHDLIYIEQAQRLANIVRNNEDKVNLISVSQGNQTNQPRNETQEGLDEKLALTYYGRWTIIGMLIKLLEAAAKEGEPARVLTIQGAGDEEAIDLQDLELKNNYSSHRSEKVASAYNSLACLRFARKYPTISFIHSHPGHVRHTDEEKQSLWQKLIALPAFGTRTPERSGEYHIYEAYTGKEFAKGAFLLDQDLTSFNQDSETTGNYSIENQDALWEHTEAMIKRAIESDLVE